MHSNTKTGKIRIISGKWRHRILHFPLEQGLRPSPDRVRETLFNWLMPYIQGAVCLDLFSGSGGLSFEALSRGAKEVVMIDKNIHIIKHLKNNAALLGAENAHIFQARVPTHPPDLPPKAFDIVFLDPPFQDNLLPICCKWLEESDLLSPSGFVYIESHHKSTLESIPLNWEIFRSKKSGNLSYALYRKI